MTILGISNPFNAPVYHEETVTSTMEISRRLALDGEVHGTVITADFQEAGRGRVSGRQWHMDKKLNLPFTILLRYSRIEDIPRALTLRAGLAVSLAIEDFAPFLQGLVLVKWPNDIMINAKKAAGILCEAVTGDVFLGIGINAAQKEFPVNLRGKATSIALEVNNELDEIDVLLEKVLKWLYDELEDPAIENWKSRLEQRLYKKGEEVVFLDGAADSGKEIKGRLTGIGDSGELLIVPRREIQARSFITGELSFS